MVLGGIWGRRWLCRMGGWSKVRRQMTGAQQAAEQEKAKLRECIEWLRRDPREARQEAQGWRRRSTRRRLYRDAPRISPRVNILRHLVMKSLRPDPGPPEQCGVRTTLCQELYPANEWLEKDGAQAG